MSQKWQVQWESGSVMDLSPKDARGVRLLISCGATWIKRPAERWKRAELVLAAVSLAEVRSASL